MVLPTCVVPWSTVINNVLKVASFSARFNSMWIICILLSSRSRNFLTASILLMKMYTSWFPYVTSFPMAFHFITKCLTLCSGNGYKVPQSGIRKSVNAIIFTSKEIWWIEYSHECVVIPFLFNNPCALIFIIFQTSLGTVFKTIWLYTKQIMYFKIETLRFGQRRK